MMFSLSVSKLSNKLVQVAGIIILSLVSNKGKAQDYHPTVSFTKEWLVEICEFGACSYDYYWLEGDTTIDNNVYSFLHGYHYNKEFLLREDISEQRVFLKILSIAQPAEYLLYDFSLTPGDSIYLENPISPAINSKGYYTLDSIREKTYYDITRRFFYLSSNDSNSFHPQALWIEGIGSTSLINTPGVVGDSENSSELVCSVENGTKIYARHPKDSCYSQPSLFVQSYPRFIKEDFRVWQAGNEIIGFEFIEHIPKGELQVFDVNGQLILEIPIASSKGEFKAFRLKTGVYFARLIDKNRVYQSEFVFGNTSWR